MRLHFFIYYTVKSPLDVFIKSEKKLEINLIKPTANKLKACFEQIFQKHALYICSCTEVYCCTKAPRSYYKVSQIFLVDHFLYGFIIYR